jgi:ice-binding like protein/Big-like domain-containing protein
MRTLMTSKSPALHSLTFFLLLSLLVAGCGREQAPANLPQVVSVTPSNGSTAVPVATSPTATFSTAMNPASINASTFTLAGPGGASVAGTVTYAGTVATFTPTLLLAASTMYTATITTGATDVAGAALGNNYVWSFTTGTVPTVTSSSPANGALGVSTNRKIIATFSEAMNPASVTTAGVFSLAVTTGSAVTGTTTFVTANNTAIFSPSANLLPNTNYTAMISTRAQSAAGNGLAANYVFTFTTGAAPDVTAPTIVITAPVAEADNVPTNQIITATFSELMDPSSITATGTFQVAVAGVGGAPVAGTVSYAGKIATFKPTANLAASTQFTATITTAAKDLAGNALSAGVVPNPWSFTTGAGTDTTPPTITITSPANAATAVALNAAVNATFSEPMNPLTIVAPGTFTVGTSGVNGTAVTGSVTYDSQTNIATFTPSANLTAATQYTATISTAAQDLAGNALASGLVPNPWDFTSGNAPGPVGPNLNTASPFGVFGGAAGITNAGLLTVINGDIGTVGASTLITGFHDQGPGCTYTETPLNVGLVNGSIDTAPPPPTVACPSEGTATTASIANQAAMDALAAYNNISPASRPGGIDPGAGQLGGLTLAPGIYKAAAGPFMITGSDLTLDAQGDSTAIWIFQAATSLTVGGPAAPRNILLVNGAQSKNVFWYVGSSATINAAGGGTMVGTIIAAAGVSFSTAGNVQVVTLEGRALSLGAAVTMVNTVVNVPAP